VVGLFAPQNVHTLSARCDSDLRLHTIRRQQVVELYYENPRFVLFLMWLVPGIVDDQGVTEAPAYG